MTQKKAIFFAGLLTLTALNVGLLSTARAENEETAPKELVSETKAPVATLSVTGTGTAKAKPDQAILKLGIQTKGKTAEEALNKNKDQTLSVLKKLQEAGLPKEAIQTEYFSVQPRYVYENSEQKQDGFEASNTLSVTIDDIEQVGKVLDDSIMSGGNQLQNIAFGLKDQSALQQTALNNALENARQKASTMASTMGLELAGVASISESGAYAVPAPMMAEGMAMMAKSSRDASSPVPVKEVEVNANVSVIWKTKVK